MTMLQQPAADAPIRLLGHQPALDGLRAVAVIAVIGAHGFTTYVPGGYAGVDVFFTLSGFLITCLLVEEHALTKRLRLGAFYMRRILRLAPALALMLLAHLLYCVAFYQGWDRKAAVASTAAAGLYISNWVRAFRIVPLGSLNHTWSLAVEEQFYLLWPVLLLLVLCVAKSRRRALVVLAAFAGCFVAYRAVLACLGAPGEWLSSGLDTRADALLIGCCTALIYSADLIRPRTWPARVVGCGGAAALAALLAFFAFAPSYQFRALFYGGYTVLALCSALLILALSSGFEGCGVIARIMRLPALTWIGKVSYGLYLWHFVLLRACGEKLTVLPKPLVTLVGVLLTFAVSACSYYLVEKPFLSLKKRFSSRSTANVPAASRLLGVEAPGFSTAGTGESDGLRYALGRLPVP